MTLNTLGLTLCFLMCAIGAAAGAASGDLIANDNASGVGVRRVSRMSPTAVGVWTLVVNVVASFIAIGALLCNLDSDPELRVVGIALVVSEMMGLAMALCIWVVVPSTETLHRRK